MKVANQFPAVEPSGIARIALVGEAPGRDESFYGTPFIGESGRILDSALGHVGIARNQCFVGNVSQERPPGESNDFSRLSWEGSEVQEGIAQLHADLKRFQPSIVLCLGNAALHLFKHGNVAPPKRGGQFDWPSKVGHWRGSLFGSEFLYCDWHDVAGVRFQEIEDQPLLKCLATYHPAAVSRDYSLQAYYRAAPGIGDLERLKLEAGSRELNLPKRGIEVYKPSADEVLTLLSSLRQQQLPTACDIEGGPDDITSIAFSVTARNAVVIPLVRLNHYRVWSKVDEALIWEGIKLLLADRSVLKIGQNFSYDAFCLASYGVQIKGQVEDTMELWWELFAELDKGLDVQASLLTKEPYYKPAREKGEMKFESDEQFWRYNGLDAAVTFECWERMKGMLVK